MLILFLHVFYNIEPEKNVLFSLYFMIIRYFPLYNYFRLWCWQFKNHCGDVYQFCSFLIVWLHFFSRCSSQSVLSFNQFFIITSFSFDFSFNVLVRVFIKCSKIFLINKLITSDIYGLQQNTIIQLISCTYHFKSYYIFDKNNFYFISYFCIEIFLEIEWVFILNNIVITWTLKFVLKIQPLIK